MQSNYPEAVNQFSQSLFDTLHQTGFFEEQQITSAIVLQKAKEQIQKESFKLWIANGEITLTDESLDKMLRMIIAENTLHSLYEKGMIDYMEDVNGDDHFFLTTKGSSIAKDILGL